VKSSQKDKGGRKGSKRDSSSQPTEKSDSSHSSSADESEAKKSRLLKEKVNRPKKAIPYIDLSPIAKQGKPSRMEVDKELVKNKIKKGKKELSEESDEEKEEKEEKIVIDKNIGNVIKVMKEELRVMSSLVNILMRNKDKANEKLDDLSMQQHLIMKDVKSLTDKEKLTGKKVEALEKKLDISQEEVQGLRESFGQQLEDFQSAGKADDNWKEVEEKMMSEMKDIKFKLGKRMKKKEMSEVILNLKEEVNELKKLIEVKVSTQYSTPTPVKYPTPVKEFARLNTGRKGEKDYHCPVHSPEVDWWKRKRKWCRPLWCDTHGRGVHTTNMCWNRKKVWRIKKKVEGDLGGSPTASPSTKKE